MPVDPARPGTAREEDQTPPVSMPREAQSSSKVPFHAWLGGDVESFAASLEFESLQSLGALYDRYADRVASLEQQLASSRPILRIIAVVFAKHLKQSKPSRSIRIGKYTYRPHKDGSGVYREKINVK